MKLMTYEEAIAFIHGAYGLGEKVGLSNMQRLLAMLGDPQERFPSVHVAGTNGKGSVCAFLHAALRKAGFTTGLYTSPFLQRYNERMRVNGIPIPDDVLARLTSVVAEAVEALRLDNVRPTVFEIGTAVAFLYFAEAGVDMAVVEVGLGGRLDPTNVLVPRVTAIASIGMDHTRVLGDTLEAIALEKAGIAKPGVPMVLSAQAADSVRTVVERRCEEVAAPVIIASPTGEDVPLGLPGMHQRYNAGVADSALTCLREQGFVISQENIREGLGCARWPGRLEWILSDPPVLLDGAHNPQGTAALADYIRGLPQKKTVLLCGIMSDKDWWPMVETFATFADEAVATQPREPRALNAGKLAASFEALGVSARETVHVSEGLRRAKEMAGAEGRVVVAGSLYLVGEARTALGLGGGLLEVE